MFRILCSGSPGPCQIYEPQRKKLMMSTCILPIINYNMPNKYPFLRFILFYCTYITSIRLITIFYNWFDWIHTVSNMPYIKKALWANLSQLKGPCHEIFDPWFFYHQSTLPIALAPIGTVKRCFIFTHYYSHNVYSEIEFKS
jgi:hypothetical protein